MIKISSLILLVTIVLAVHSEDVFADVIFDELKHPNNSGGVFAPSGGVSGGSFTAPAGAGTTGGGGGNGGGFGGSSGGGISCCAQTGSTSGLATRIFAGPTEYPPTEYAAYGIVAFRSMPSPNDVARYADICAAYYNTLPPPPPEVPKSKQMVTVWPVLSTDVSRRLKKPLPADQACKEALSSYNQASGHKAIQAARLQGKDVDGIGPYLLAWSPSERFGADKAVILVADFSNVRTYAQAQRAMIIWVDEIESDPQIWQNGFSLARLKQKIKTLVDRYGADLESIFKAKS